MDDSTARTREFEISNQVMVSSRMTGFLVKFVIRRCEWIPSAHTN